VKNRANSPYIHFHRRKVPRQAARTDLAARMPRSSTAADRLNYRPHRMRPDAMSVVDLGNVRFRKSPTGGLNPVPAVAGSTPRRTIRPSQPRLGEKKGEALLASIRRAFNRPRSVRSNLPQACRPGNFLKSACPKIVVESGKPPRYNNWTDTVDLHTPLRNRCRGNYCDWLRSYCTRWASPAEEFWNFPVEAQTRWILDPGLRKCAVVQGTSAGRACQNT